MWQNSGSSPLIKAKSICPDKATTSASVSHIGLTTDEGHCDVGIDEPVVRHERHFRRPNKEHARRRKQTAQFFESSGLSRSVEVNQEIPAKNDIVRRISFQEIIAQQVFVVELYTIAHSRIQHVAFFRVVKMAVAKTEVFGAKGIFAIYGLPGSGQGMRGDIDSMNRKAMNR